MNYADVFNIDSIDPSWQPCIIKALSQMDQNYLLHLSQNKQWLPGADKIFNAFSLPVLQINYVLLGESPYPRAQSANGYAFWDEAVTNLWSEKGLSKTVNRATSLRNIIKMLLVTEGFLKSNQTSQPAIADISKDNLVKTNQAFFNNLLQHGFLLLNASLVLQSTKVKEDAKTWQPFLKIILDFLFEKRPEVTMILFGKIAYQIDALINHTHIRRLYAEHPYNLSFINNPTVIQFFQPLHLLTKKNLSNKENIAIIT